ncbi:hypothetical protein COCON_G00000720 [Conger conger]|uniref:Ig-like domain-containing protein n=1 Tax=Conger conger TaxID=82655 RepID=A0A9Q1I880_CONCO|nr:hypothetical protein COCON_G00000720 [Conger conger]
MMRIMRSLIFALHLLILIPAAEISVPVVAAPGSDITLSCSFPRSETDLLFNLIVVWDHGDEVVHSYYKATGHLEEQSPAYRGRTQLSPDQLAVGDASLRLTGVRASDHGKYTCDVANEQGRKIWKQIFLTVAAAYEEPELAIQTTCDSIILTFLSTLGFPEPTVLWRTETGSDITNRSNTTMVLKGGGEHYEVVSEMVLKQSDPHTVTFEMRLELLNQSFSRSVSLHPLPDCQGTPVRPWNRLFLFLLLLVVPFFLAIAVFWYKSSLPHGPGNVDVPVGTELVPIASDDAQL